ncbi:alpha/beta fold hydrolase [Streptomyces sp. NPDC055287]
MTDPYHEVCGTGPVLLLIPGGAGDPTGFEEMTARLSGRFTVVTYDPLGLSRGLPDGPVGDQRVRTWSENAHRLLDELLPAGDSAYAFGSSSGAITALDLLARHPDRLRRVVAHEPPVTEVLPDAARHRAMFAEVYDVFRARGLGPAAARLNAGLTDDCFPDTADGPGPGAGADVHPSHATGPSSPMEIFVARVLRQFTAYVPDVATLKPLSARLAVGVGRDSRGQLLYRTAASLAGQLGSEPVEFPGGHIGCAEHPAEFAELLAETLLQAPAPGGRPIAQS